MDITEFKRIPSACLHQPSSSTICERHLSICERHLSICERHLSICESHLGETHLETHLGKALEAVPEFDPGGRDPSAETCYVRAKITKLAL